MAPTSTWGTCCWRVIASATATTPPPVTRGCRWWRRSSGARPGRRAHPRQPGHGGALAFTVVGIARLVRAWGHHNGDLVALAFLASPVTLSPAAPRVTSSGRWRSSCGGPWRTCGARACGGRALRTGDREPLLDAAARGCFLVADGWDRAHRRRCLATRALALPLGAAMFIPRGWRTTAASGSSPPPRGGAGSPTTSGAWP